MILPQVKGYINAKLQGTRKADVNTLRTHRSFMNKLLQASDKDGDCSLSVTELRGFLKDIGAYGGDVSIEKCERLFKEIGSEDGERVVFEKVFEWYCQADAELELTNLVSDD